MGGSSSSADINNLKTKVSALETKTSDIATLKQQLQNVSSTLAGSIEYDKLAQKLTETSYNQKIAEAISKNPGELGSNVGKTLYANPEAVKGIWTGLSSDINFAKILSGTLTDEKQSVFKDALKGDKGDVGSIGANTLDAKRSLYDKPKNDPNAKAGYTMWCADGGLCKLPVDSTGIQWSKADGSVKGGSKIYEDDELNIETDNIIRFKTSMGGNKTPMEINTGGAVVNGDLEVTGKINYMSIGSPAPGDLFKNGLNIKNPNDWTHFNSQNSGKNFIRGDTELSNNVDIKGTLKVNNRNILEELDQLKKKTINLRESDGKFKGRESKGWWFGPEDLSVMYDIVAEDKIGQLNNKTRNLQDGGGFVGDRNGWVFNPKDFSDMYTHYQDRNNFVRKDHWYMINKAGGDGKKCLDDGGIKECETGNTHMFFKFNQMNAV